MEGIDFKKPLFRKKLYLSTKPYFLKRSREDGEKDLEKLVDTSNCEGCWLFDIDNSVWLNLVSATEQIPHDKGINGLRAKLFPIDFTYFESFSHYHFHPKTKEDELKQTMAYSTNQKAKEIMENYAAISLAIPSSKDISEYLKIIRKKPSFVDFKIASPRGIITINFDKLDEFDSPKKRYSEVTTAKNVTGIAVKARNPNEAILQGINYINEAMKPIFIMRFEYRKELI